MKPDCFESEEQYASWESLLRVTKAARANFCQDCTPSYAAAMRLQGRCEHPDMKIPNPYNVTDEDFCTKPGPKPMAKTFRIILSDI